MSDQPPKPPIQPAPGSPPKIEPTKVVDAPLKKKTEPEAPAWAVAPAPEEQRAVQITQSVVNTVRAAANQIKNLANSLEVQVKQVRNDDHATRLADKQGIKLDAVEQLVADLNAARDRLIGS